MVDAVTPAEGATPDAQYTNEQIAEMEAERSKPELGDGGKAALDAERKARREAEKQAKAATAELQKLQEANMNEVDRALKAAEDKGRSDGLREAGIGRVEDGVRAAAGGRDVDVDALLDGLDRTKFLDDDGQPDRDAIQAWVDRIAPPHEERGDGFQMPDLAQGTRSTASLAGGSGDALESDLKRMLGIR